MSMHASFMVIISPEEISIRLSSLRLFWSKRSSHRRCSVKKGVLRNFAAQVFSCEFCEISKDTFFTENLRATASDDTLFNFMIIWSIFWYLHLASHNMFTLLKLSMIFYLVGYCTLCTEVSLSISKLFSHIDTCVNKLSIYF